MADRSNHLIRKISPSAEVTTLAGAAGIRGTADGVGVAARFNEPLGVAVGPAGDVFVADRNNHTIRRVTQSGLVSTVAGEAGAIGTADGQGSAARFSAPYSVAVDSAGNVYVADYDNHAIRKISPAGLVTTFAGVAGQPGHADGRGAAARFYRPMYLSIDSAGNLFVSEREQHLVRRITPDAAVSTLAGSTGDPGERDQDQFSLSMPSPRSVAFTLRSAPDFQGVLAVTNERNFTIRQFVRRGDSSSATLDIESGTSRIDVGFSLPGGYEAVIADPVPWPDYWGATAPPETDGRVHRLTARLRAPAHLLRPASTARFWVTGAGWVGAVPYATEVAFNWTPPAGTGAGTYGYRVQLFDGPTPVSEATPLEFFNVAAPVSCNPTSDVLCLGNGRFKAEARWATREGRTGRAKAVVLTPDTGYFWFFDPSNIEVALKVLDGCSLNRSFWVFAGGLTNIQVELTVTDLQTGYVKTYANAQGTPFQPIQDTAAFETCSIAAADSGPGLPENGPLLSPEGIRPLAAVTTGCVEDDNSLCLRGDRFRVQAQWTRADGRTGSGKAIRLTNDTGYFWFFRPSNLEIVTKVLTGCGLNGQSLGLRGRPDERTTSP